ncbi:MAG: hypothetical protein AB7E49_05785 [Campylobacterales bacterium]
MTQTVGAREILRNPSLLKIGPKDTLVVEDKRSHTMLGLYVGTELAEAFLAYQKKAKMLESAHKIAASSKAEYEALEGTIDDGL